MLIDDIPGYPGLLNEHGLSFWIEADDHRILFDTGQTEALLHNARTLGIDLATADAVILSHGHYDHTGGLSAFMEQNPSAPVYCHIGATVPHYSLRDDGLTYEIGMPRTSAATLTGSGGLRPVERPLEIVPDINLTGPVPRTTPYEDTGGGFFLDPEARHADPIEDDLSLWIQTERGILLVCGCCHAGIVNTLQYLATLRSLAPVRTIIGGMHLLNASQERLDATLHALSAASPELIVPCHCTGEGANEALISRFSTRVKPGKTGLRIDLS